MSIKKLKMLREQAWTPTPLGDKFSLHFDDTKYLQLISEHFAQEVASFSCVTGTDPEQINTADDLYAEGYAEGYNSAVQQIQEHIRERYTTK